MSSRTTNLLGGVLAVLVGAASYGVTDRLLDAPPPEPRRTVSVEVEAPPPGPPTPPPSPSPAAPPAPAPAPAPATLPSAEAGQVTTSCRHGACTVCVGDDCRTVGVPGTGPSLPAQGGTSRSTSTVCVNERCTTTTTP